MDWLFHADIQHLITLYGYGAVAAVVALESLGLPLPGETILIAAAIYAGSTHALSIALVIIAAFAGAVIGGSIGYWIGREIGFRLLISYGAYVHLDEPKIKLGQYLFWRHGGKVVFFGRFVALLRAAAAFLAGLNCMEWPRFLLFNAAGGAAWATTYGLAAFLIGHGIQHFAGWVGYLAIAGAVVSMGAAAALVRRNLARLEDEAQRKFPGPLRLKRRR